MGRPPDPRALPDKRRRLVNHHDIAREAYEHHHASQRQDELAAAVAVVAAVEPQVIVEIGCDGGGTLFCWRQLCDSVYGITLADNSWPTGGQSCPLETHGATVLRGDSHDLASLSWLQEKLGERLIDVLHIDGDHSKEGVDADYTMYSPLVRPGGLVLVHDVLNHWDPRVKVHEWWTERFPNAKTISSRRSRPVGFGVITKE
jgi:cephalosporin hydroxylase